MNKRADEALFENVIFLVLNIIFFSVMLIFVIRTAQGASIYEEVYAKKIALLIDDSKPNTNLEINISKILELAEKNNIAYNTIFDIKDNKVKVKLVSGFSFEYFSDYKILSSINLKTQKLEMEIQK